MSKENSIKPLSKEGFYIANPKDVVITEDIYGLRSLSLAIEGDVSFVYKIKDGSFHFNTPRRKYDYSNTLQFIQREFDANGIEVFSERVGINSDGVISYANSQMVS